MRPRIAEEWELLQRAYPNSRHAEFAGEDWFLLPEFPLPDGWEIGGKAAAAGNCSIAFKLSAGYPTAAPYGFVTPAGITFKGTPPGNPGASVAPPFEGTWQHFSWAPEAWQAGPTARDGSNILVWVRGIHERLREGA